MLKEKIIAYSKSIGIDQIGFASADVFHEMRNRLEVQSQLNYQSGFEEKDLTKRTTPAKLLPKAKSIIAIAIAYPSKMKNAPKSTLHEPRGIFCRASWGLDYHILVKEKLKQLESYILSQVPEAQCLSMVDTGELVDRAVAERAGIGWSGKNCSIISPKFGSYIYLGEMITSLELEPDMPMESKCGSCTKCMDACPTNAFVAAGQLNAKKCIAYLTQTKTEIPQEFLASIGNRLYGCDTCQVVCPENRGIDFHLHSELEPVQEDVKPTLSPILQMSNRSFNKRFGTLAGSWRGRTPIQRNAIIALVHFNHQTSVPMLKELINDPREVIRKTAEWAMHSLEQKANSSASDQDDVSSD